MFLRVNILNVELQLYCPLTLCRKLNALQSYKMEVVITSDQNINVSYSANYKSEKNVMFDHPDFK